MSAIDDLLNTMARLRAPDGCPWDREQDHQSLARCLVEECSELLDTIDRLDMDHMREELGDVLLQVVFHAQIAAENGLFDFDDVAAGINAKLLLRHPHVFGNATARTAAEVLVQWEEIKAREKKTSGEATGIFKKFPPRLPALLFAWETVKQARKHGAMDRLIGKNQSIGEIAENLTEEEAGGKLFELVAACHMAGIDPESALRRHTHRLIRNAEKQNQKALNLPHEEIIR